MASLKSRQNPLRGGGRRGSWHLIRPIAQTSVRRVRPTILGSQSPLLRSRRPLRGTLFTVPGQLSIPHVMDLALATDLYLGDVPKVMEWHRVLNRTDEEEQRWSGPDVMTVAEGLLCYVDDWARFVWDDAIEFVALTLCRVQRPSSELPDPHRCCDRVRSGRHLRGDIDVVGRVAMVSGVWELKRPSRATSARRLCSGRRSRFAIGLLGCWCLRQAEARAASVPAL